jgi:uncharacterized protein YqhQ
LNRNTYGGQAVIEGVMMRGASMMAVAVRDPSGRVIVKTEPIQRSKLRARLAKVPLVRGVFVLWDSLVLGMRTLTYSATVAMGPEEGSDTPSDSSQVALPQGAMWGTIAASLALAIGLFFVTPVLIMSLLDPMLPSSLASNIVEKLIRLAFILGYMAAIALMPDVRRVFQYHGAEHKTIMAYEAGASLDVDTVAGYTRVHPRCGTTFLVVVVLVSFVLFALLGQPPLLERIASRVLLIPVVAGIAYEIIRLGAEHYDLRLVRSIISPGLAVQALTTREPDASQIEVAIAALEAVLAGEQQDSPARQAA